jgi:hypothetical protein
MNLVTIQPAKLAVLLLYWSFAPRGHATYWTHTAHCIEQNATYLDEAGYTKLILTTATIRKGVPITATATSSIETVHYDDDLTEHLYFYDPADILPEDVVPTQTSAATPGTVTQYMQATVYTAPSTCPTPFTVSTTATIDIPQLVADSYTPISQAVLSRDETVWVAHLLSEGAVALPPESAGDIASALSACDTDVLKFHNFIDRRATTYRYTSYTSYTYSWYSYSYSTRTSTRTSYYGGGSIEDATVCSVMTGCTNFRTWVIAVVVVLVGLFLLGFLESFLWFRRLMLGKSALRGGTCCWICLFVFVLCLTRREKARTSQDQVALRQQWKGMGFGKRLSLWLKWGFRHSYPVAILGDPKASVVAYAPKPEAGAYATVAAPQAAYVPPSGYVPASGYPPPCENPPKPPTGAVHTTTRTGDV